MNPSSAMALASAGVRSAARTVVSASALTKAVVKRFSVRVAFMLVCFWLLDRVRAFVRRAGEARTVSSESVRPGLTSAMGPKSYKAQRVAHRKSFLFNHAERL